MSDPQRDCTALAGRLGAFVCSWGAQGSFEELALDVFRYQYERNEPYRRFCTTRGADPASVTSWTAVPAAPADAYRFHDLTCSAEPPAALFLTSGTTAAGPGSRGRHFMDACAMGLYYLSLTTAFDRLASRCRDLPIRAILPPWSESPHSSLSHMVSALASRQPEGAARFFWKNEGPDLDAAARSLQDETEPMLLFTTAFALLELLDTLERPLTLPAGSMIIETGGFKGRRRRLDRDALYSLAMERLGIPASSIGSEYGMCEMASQFYDDYLSGPPAALAPGALPPAVKIGPPWVRTQRIDAASGNPAAPGEPGLLRHFDLCNLNSVLAIQTMDVGIPAGAGFVLEGRAEGAVPRGCSLTIEEWRARVDSGEDA